MTKETFSQALENRILLFDGAMGTEIQKLEPKSEDFPDGKDGFNDGLSSSRPEWIKKIHRTYLEAGADCIETNTFGSNKIKLDEYGFGEQTVELNKKKCLTFLTNAVKKKSKVFIYGASTKGNTLLQYYGINHKLIKFAAERSPEKWGKYTIGTGIKIISEKAARDLNPKYFFVMPYAFIKEFIIREKKWLKKGGKFILPYPNFKVLNK